MNPHQQKQICDEVVKRLRECSETLLREIRRFVEFADNEGAEIIQNGCVGCLAHLAVLCDFIGRREPNSKPQMDGMCDWSLEQLGELTREMCFDEYTYLDLLLKVRRWVDSLGRKGVLIAFGPLIRSRGKDHWPYSIHESVTSHTKKAHLYAFIELLSQRHGRTSRSGFRTSPLFRSLRNWCSSMVGKRVRPTRTFSWLQSGGTMGYEFG